MTNSVIKNCFIYACIEFKKYIGQIVEIVINYTSLDLYYQNRKSSSLNQKNKTKLYCEKYK
jgi:hypothetical protein